MDVLPVLDLLDGLVVRGVAGRRDEYRPVESRLAPTADVASIARAIGDQLGLRRFYVADLDAILHARPNFSIYRRLADEGFHLMVDAGLRDAEQARHVLAAGAAELVVGLETSPGPHLPRELCERFGPERVVFSLDMQDGRPLADPGPWETADPFRIGVRVATAGVRQMIVLDLAQVGVSRGVGTSDLCRRLRARFPDLRLITGGGVRGGDDLRDLKALGLDGVLVASALHDGTIGRREIESLTATRR